MQNEIRGARKRGCIILTSILRFMGDKDAQCGSSSIRQRAAIFFTLFAMLLIGSLGYLFLQGSKQATQFDKNISETREKVILEFAKLRGEQLSTFAYDYSFWPEFVEFTYNVDSVWAASNIDLSIQTWDLDIIAILDSTMKIVYASKLHDTEQVQLPSLPIWNLQEWKEHDYTCRFYLNNVCGICEYVMAPMQRIRTETNDSPIIGYMVAYRDWDEEELMFFDSTLGGTSRFIFDSVCHHDSKTGSVFAHVPLESWNGVRQGWLENEYQSSVVDKVSASQRATLLTVIIFALILLFGGGYLIRRWFLDPMKLLELTLESKNSMLSHEVSNHPREIVSSLKLLQEMIANQVALEHEIEHRQAAEAEAIFHSRQLKEAMAERDFVLEQAKIALYRHDTEGHFHYFSPGIFNITGYEPSELKRHYSYLLTDDPINLTAMRSTERALETGQPQEPYVVQIRRKDGSLGHMEVAEVPFYDGEKVDGIVGICRDITDEYEMRQERDRLSASYEKSKRMESMVVLAGGVAHDLNNTLGPLVSYPALLREQLDPQSKGYRYLNTMEQAARQAADVVKDLLILARRGRLVLEPSRLSAMVQDAVQSTSVQDRLKDHTRVTLVTRFPEEEPYVMASASHLVRCVQNLVINAIEAMESPGEVTVEVSSRTETRINPASHHEEESQVMLLSVADTGVGISKEQITKIFEPYYSTKEMGRSGSGLGLALVYSIVREHGGYHEVSSAVGKGTTISLIIPSIAAEQHQLTRIVIGDQPSSRILVVDDLDIQRELLKTLLESRGHHVVTAGSTAEAIDIYRKQVFDLALLDMILEEKTDGADLYESLLAIRSPLPCVIVTGFGPGHRLDHALRLGAYGVLTKPYTIPQLEDSIRAALESVGRNNDGKSVGERFTQRNNKSDHLHLTSG